MLGSQNRKYIAAVWKPDYQETTNSGKHVLWESVEKMIEEFISAFDILDVSKDGSCIILVNLPLLNHTSHNLKHT